MIHTQSEKIMSQSRSVFPGGVNSPVRSFRSVGGTPVVFEHGEGAQLFDVDGNSYIDFCSSWGPLILGYSHKEVVEAVREQALKAMSFGAPSRAELRLGEKIKEWIPGIDLLRFVSSGTEATMSAIRVARAATGRNLIVKFEGCYHGHADCLLVAAGSGLATLGKPSSAGVPEGAAQDTCIVPFNCVKSLEDVFAKDGKNIAAIIVEPVACNMGLVPAVAGYLEFLRDVTKKHGALLIFDEVMTGFRLGKGGAAERFGIEPDLWTFGKIVGGGLPAAAYGGKAKVMEHVAPLGGAYQAGTLSGNPMAMVAGLTTLCEIERLSVFEKLETLGATLDSFVQSQLATEIQKGRLCYVREKSFFCFFFGTNKAPTNFAEVSACDMGLFNKVYHAWLEDGVYLGPSGYEVGFLSYCHTKEHLQALVASLKRSLSKF